jgi:hypothetical protein
LATAFEEIFSPLQFAAQWGARCWNPPAIGFDNTFISLCLSKSGQLIRFR